MGKIAMSLVLAVFCSISHPVAAQTSNPETTLPGSTPELRVFDFLGQNTETPSTMTSLNGVPCKTSKDGHRRCTAFNRPEIGGVTLKLLGMNFYNDKLLSLFGAAEPRFFPALLSAFSAKYGPPEMQTRKWQNRAGATFDNTVAVWRFRGGNLELAAIGSQIDVTDFMFVSIANSPPTPAPKVDF
jgi:hypothetical protein